MKDQIEECIKKKFNLVKDLIPEENYTIDFALSPDLDVDKTWIVEINNPPPVAGTSLFNWDLESDRNIIHEGPFELRILKEAIPDVRSRLEPSLVQYILELRGVEYEIPRANNHLDYSCDGCNKFPISDKEPFAWYYCTTCKKNRMIYVLNVTKKNTNDHDKNHKFKRVKSTFRKGTETQETSSESVEEGRRCIIN